QLSSSLSGRNSAVECQLPKLDVAGSTPVARSITFFEDRRQSLGRVHASRQQARTLPLKTAPSSASDQGRALNAAMVSASALGTCGESVPKSRALTPQVARAHSKAGP